MDVAHFHRYRRLTISVATCLAVFMAPFVLQADDLEGAEVILCGSTLVHHCTASGGCESKPPWDYNIPVFVEIDFEQRVIRTTDASNENRSTPLTTLKRDEPFVILQGVEQGRAFSAVIATDVGLATFSIAADGETFSVFGACTPSPTAQ